MSTTSGDEKESLPIFFLAVTGSPHVGKTCLLSRFCNDKFSEIYVSTSGVDHKIKIVTIEGEQLNLKVWDFSGQERFRNLTDPKLRRSHGIMVVFDVTNQESFNRLDHLFNGIKETACKDAFKLLVGNKCDSDARVVDFATAKEYADHQGVPYLETSCKKSTGVTEAFLTLATSVYSYLKGKDKIGFGMKKKNANGINGTEVPTSAAKGENASHGTCITNGTEASTSAVKGRKLFTLGPVSVSRTVKQAMLHDESYLECINFIHKKLLEVAGVESEEFCCIPIHGSGTLALEAAIQTAVSRETGKAFIIENGTDAKQMIKICESAKIAHDVQGFRADQQVESSVVEEALRQVSRFDVVGIVQCEKNSGVINPIAEVGKIVKQLSPDAVYLVDARSSFGVMPSDMKEGCIDILVGTADRCLQGVPGASFVIARKTVLARCKDNPRSLSLNLHDQLEHLDKTRQLEISPAPPAMVAFKQALLDYEHEGALTARAVRYKQNHGIIKTGMEEIGFKLLVDVQIAGFLTTAFLFSKDPDFSFAEFQKKIASKGCVIGLDHDSGDRWFSIGNAGDLLVDDMKILLTAVREVCAEMNLSF